MGDPPSSHLPPYDPDRYRPHDYSLVEPGYGQPPVRPVTAYVFGVYAALLMLAGLAVLAMGLWCKMDPQTIIDMQSQSALGRKGLTHADLQVASVYYLVIGALYVLGPAVWFVLPRSGVKWLAAIPLLAVSVLTCCCAPLAVVVFVFWLLPGTRAYYWS